MPSVKQLCIACCAAAVVSVTVFLAVYFAGWREEAVIAAAMSGSLASLFTMGHLQASTETEETV